MKTLWKFFDGLNTGTVPAFTAVRQGCRAPTGDGRYILVDVSREKIRKVYVALSIPKKNWLWEKNM
jgi:hypothetical protein